MGRAGRIAWASAGAIVLVLLLAQIFLPRIAASRISARLERYGKVQSVSVTAFPAVKLLWGDADLVTVKAGALSMSPAQSAALLWEGRGASSIDMTAQQIKEGPLQLSDVRFTKRGSSLAAQASTTQAHVKAALPEGLAVALLGSGGGSVRVRATGGLFGLSASVEAVAGASDGKLVVHPLGYLLEGVQLTLFADPHVRVEGVGASSSTPAGGETTYRLSMSATLG